MLQLFLFVIASAFSFPRIYGNALERLAQGLHEIEQQASVTSRFGKPTKPTPKEVEQLTKQAFDAVKKNDLDIVKRLEAAGADLTSQETGGTTLIDVALKHGSPDLVQFLLAKGGAKKISRDDIWKMSSNLEKIRRGQKKSEFYKRQAHLED